MTPPLAIAFDLDGTLVDSRRDLAAALNAVRGELGYPPLALDAVVAMVGEGSRRLVRQGLPESVAGAAFEAAFERYRELYFGGCLRETRPYPGIEDAVAALARRVPLAVVTNKPQRHTLRVLGGLGLAPWFRVVLGGDSLARSKPHPEPLVEAARRLGAPVTRTLLVGDSAVDAETARAAGAPVALVRWGFGGAAELAPYDAVLRPATPGELAAWLLR